MISAGQNTAFSTNKTLNIGGRLITLQTPLVMGVINVTPDSFYAGSRQMDEKEILKQAEKMLTDGASLIDVGGYSSRPGAENISEQEEEQRVLSTIQAIKKTFPEAILSIDTFRSGIARKAVSLGADMINDISGGDLDADMFNTVAHLQVPYCCMHMKGTPETMNNLTQYSNLIHEIITYFHQKVAALQQAGEKDIILDPGFGFAKTVEQNFQLMHNLDVLKILKKPLLVGISRKSMIWKTLQTTPEHALNGTTALNMVALMKGASILRVHDVKEAVEAVKLFTHLTQADDRV
ncbi:MAG: dihydropteroate synthase [Cyclobacteriaceae bacterium]|nr:dihydropteroate synthase [Cyclobacteriaceae bacterium]